MEKHAQNRIFWYILVFTTTFPGSSVGDKMIKTLALRALREKIVPVRDCPGPAPGPLQNYIYW